MEQAEIRKLGNRVEIIPNILAGQKSVSFIFSLLGYIFTVSYPAFIVCLFVFAYYFSAKESKLIN